MFGFIADTNFTDLLVSVPRHPFACFAKSRRWINSHG